MSNTDTNSAKSVLSPSPSKKFIANDHLSALVSLFSPEEPYENSERSAIEFLSKLLLEITVLEEKLAHQEQQDLAACRANDREADSKPAFEHPFYMHFGNRKRLQAPSTPKYSQLFALYS